MHTLKALKLAACRKRRRAREVVDANGAVGRWKPRVGAGSIGASSMALARTHASPSAPGLSASSLASSLLCPSFPSPAGQGCMLIRRVQLSKCATQAGRRSRGADIRGIIRRTCSDIASCTIVVPPTTIDPSSFFPVRFVPAAFAFSFAAWPRPSVSHSDPPRAS
jgi:hypothetical protein